jgi:predicted metal-dependent phosphoesterase TrpH
MRVDLHLHTTSSDGLYTPSELVKLAITRGLMQHITIAIRPTESAARRLINWCACYFPGIELSARRLEHA